MGKFNLEDYRHPWETGPHWELKKEFIEKYSDMFPEDRLLCLAQAYSNIVLMHCSYPDPVMRQISLLSQPLKMRKRFQESNSNEKESQPQKGKRKATESKKSSKFIKFCASSEQLASTFESNSSISGENVLKEPVHNFPESSKVSTIDNNKLNFDSQPSQSIVNVVKKDNENLAVKSNAQSEQSIQDNIIISKLGLELINNFLSKVRKFQAKSLSPCEAIISAAQNLKINSEVLFEIKPLPNCPPHAPIFCSELSIKDCIISSEQASSKKKAKAQCAETALNNLIKISSGNRTETKEKVIPSEVVSPMKSTNIPFVKEENMDTKDLPKNFNKLSEMYKHPNAGHGLSAYKNFPFRLNRTMFDASLNDGFVLLDDLSLKAESQRNSRALLSCSAGFCKKSFVNVFDENPHTNPPSVIASVVLGGNVVATGVSLNKNEAKIIACDNAIETLKKKYYTLKVKSEYSDGFIITRNQVFEGESFSSNVISESNIGCKMLMNMGWTGGGLGTSGIAEPVEAQSNNRFGSGLGYNGGDTDLKLFKKRIHTMLQDYCQTNTLSSLVFSKEFTKDERKEIHRMAQKYNLHTASRGTDDDRFLTVRHKYAVTQVLTQLVKNGGSNGKFELVDASNIPFEFFNKEKSVV